jgi:uncharacterized protein involved in tolerance to divalent cations
MSRNGKQQAFLKAYGRLLINHTVQYLPEVKIVMKGSSFDLTEVRAAREVKILQSLQLPVIIKVLLTKGNCQSKKWLKLKNFF